jgi:hypothetical protein
MAISRERLKKVLWVGDVIVIGVITLVGFASHGEVLTAGFRMLTTFGPLLLSWILVGFLSESFDLDRSIELKQIWRPGLAMLAAGPLAVVIRAFLLDSRPIIPIFALVVTLTNILGILIWRFIFTRIAQRKGHHNG